MWCKKIRLISLFVVLSGIISCISSNPFVLKSQVQDRDNIFSDGKTYIRLEELKDTKGASKTLLDHPQYFDKDMLASVLSSIYFQEKDIKGWSKEQHAFHENELLSLTPHMANAFTRASPSQYILVNSSYKKGKRPVESEVYTVFGLFVSGDKLNVVFSRIKYEGIVNKGRDKTLKFDSKDAAFVDPFSIRRTPFWKISIRPGQQLKKGHENWLIIDLEKDVFVKKEDHEKRVSPSDKKEVSKTTGIGEVISASPSKEIIPGSPSKDAQQSMSIKDQLLELKELESTGLINKEDYEFRKSVILGSSKQDKSIRDKFNELYKLREDGFINDTDYEHKKRELLEESDKEEKGKNIKVILSEYLELRDEGFITDNDYEYKKKILLREF